MVVSPDSSRLPCGFATSGSAHIDPVPAARQRAFAGARTKQGDPVSEPVVVGLLGITHPHASARVRALREIDGVEVVAAADDDSRLKYFTDKYDLEPRTIDEILDDERINAIMVHSKSRDMVPHTVRA